VSVRIDDLMNASDRVHRIRPSANLYNDVQKIFY